MSYLIFERRGRGIAGAIYRVIPAEEAPPVHDGYIVLRPAADIGSKRNRLYHVHAHAGGPLVGIGIQHPDMASICAEVTKLTGETCEEA